MANWQDPRMTGVTAATVGVPRAARDAGLRSYMLSVYNYMASGVLLTGIVAMLFANSSLINLIVNPATGQATPLFWIALFAPLAIVFMLGFGINRISAGTAVPWREGDVPHVDTIVGIAAEEDRVAVALGDEVVVSPRPERFAVDSARLRSRPDGWTVGGLDRIRAGRSDGRSAAHIAGKHSAQP